MESFFWINYLFEYFSKFDETDDFDILTTVIVPRDELLQPNRNSQKVEFLYIYIYKYTSNNNRIAKKIIIIIISVHSLTPKLWKLKTCSCVG